ncbi:MAG: YwqI/YxiC family protein [Bacillus sp. (in: firmicutes)]
MDSEIKIIYTEVEQALEKLRSTADTLDSVKLQKVEGETILDVANKINTLNETLTSIMETYKQVLLDNERSTSRSIQAMKEVDESLSSVIGK